MGHLCDGADVDLKAVEHFIQAVAFYEDQIFSKRAKMLERQRRRWGLLEALLVSGAVPC